MSWQYVLVSFDWLEANIPPPSGPALAHIYSKWILYGGGAEINPISAGVLENQDMLGGGSQFDPPLNPMFDVQI